MYLNTHNIVLYTYRSFTLDFNGLTVLKNVCYMFYTVKKGYRFSHPQSGCLVTVPAGERKKNRKIDKLYSVLVAMPSTICILLRTAERLTIGCLLKK
jgi:hypothetical protein